MAVRLRADTPAATASAADEREKRPAPGARRRASVAARRYVSKTTNKGISSRLEELAN